MEHIMVKFNDSKLDDIDKLIIQIHSFLKRLSIKLALYSVESITIKNIGYSNDDFINGKNTLIITWSR